MRKPIAISTVVFGDENQFVEVYVVCEDGAVFKLDATDISPRWEELPQIPGTVKQEIE